MLNLHALRSASLRVAANQRPRFTPWPSHTRPTTRAGSSHPETIARITRLDLRARQVVEGFISGMHKSPFFGHSVEFVQHREYTAGDDIRHLDWKVWSKTDRFYIKQYEAETNLRCHAGRRRQRVDALRPRAAEQVRVRLHRRRLPRLPAAAAAGRGRPASPSTRTCAQIVPPRSQQTHIDAIVKAMHVSQPREKTDIEKILRRVAESTPAAGMIVIVSDLLVDREPLFRGLEMLRHRRHDVLVFHVLDDDELTFPFAGTTRFEGMEELPQPAVRPAGAARRLPGSAGRIPGRGAPRLHAAGHRLHAGPHRRLPRRGAVEVPAPPHGGAARAAAGPHGERL